MHSQLPYVFKTVISPQFRVKAAPICYVCWRLTLVLAGE